MEKYIEVEIYELQARNGFIFISEECGQLWYHSLYRCIWNNILVQDRG